MICVSLQWNEFLLRLESALTSLLEGKSLDSNCSAELSRSLLGTTVVFTGRAFNIKANDLRLGIEFSDDIAIRIRDEQFAVFNN